ncbi:peptidase M32 [Vibrio sp. qd031]|uniref:carboxypeptidase M32 n=1 Tax=Vibrio sp. qd031 TaxID=1603038 RepID=UPI000A10C8D2|nr:carboxypeptidase M32 [Vibrio sp. qd031]ORT50007.1 peptidase M32 [Vibrio sp. qd031]
MSSYSKLKAHFQKIYHFKHLSAIAGWDQATMMPSGGNQARSQALAELSVHIHNMTTEPQLEDWFSSAESEPLSSLETSSLREMKREWRQATVLPAKLVQAKAIAGSKCEHAWRTQRGENDWVGFEKNWQSVVALSQEEAQIRGQSQGLSAYDAMLDIYEPGINSAQLDTLFGDTKQWLPQLINQIIEHQQARPTLRVSDKPFAIEQQKALGVDVMKLLQFDFERGRLDVSMHPFCGGVAEDLRLTTRYDQNDFTQSLMGIVHETGHARYEQSLPRDLLGLPVAEARSMGIHESQSLFFEMQLGRSANFIPHLSTLAKKHFTQHPSNLFDVDNLRNVYTQVEKGYIRVDADEATYPAHVILRYEIEKDLINGDIKHTDVPELWDLKMQQYLGLSTNGNFKNGCMQDIHWTDGSFGYFPSYTLGAMYAAQFMATIKQKMDVDEIIRSGDLSPIFNWLDTNIWNKGSTLTTDELVKQATGSTLNAQFFQDHLKNRYL